MKHRIFALFLVLVLLVGVLAGCGKKNNGDSDTSNGNSSIITPTKNDQSQVTSKYAYKPTYLTVPAEVDSVTGVAAKGSTVWFTASIPDGEQTETYTYTDENGEKVYYDQTVYIGDTEYNIPPLTQEQVDDFKAMVDNASVGGNYDSDILDIINEEAAAFFSGDKSADDVAALIQNRVSIYLGETS